MTVYIMMDANGVVRQGTYGAPQDMAQPAFAGLTLVAVSPDDQRIVMPASAKPRPTPRAWLERLSQSTQEALETAVMSNAKVANWLRKATAASDGIDVTLQETKDGVTAIALIVPQITAADQMTLLTP